MGSLTCRSKRPRGRLPQVRSILIPRGPTNSANTQWGLSSYSASWQVFGDQGTRLTSIQDGLSNTIIFNDKYAVAQRPSGNPRHGATLWGYGVDPRTIPNDFIPPFGSRAVSWECSMGQRSGAGIALCQRLLAAQRLYQSRRASPDGMDRQRTVDVPVHAPPGVCPAH